MRPDWDEFYMGIAERIATRATCDRKHVGCVITVDNRIVVGGYNGSIAGLPHCTEVGHLMVDGHCQRVIHAESNAVADAARRGVSLNGGVVYVTALPCWLCFKLLMQAGIQKIVFGEPYRADDELAKQTKAAASALGVVLVCTSEGKQ